MHVEAVPKVLPGEHMVCHQGIEATHARYSLARLKHALRNGLVARGIERGQLLQHQRFALLDVDFQFLPDVSRFLGDPALNREKLSVEERSRSRRLRDMNIRLAGAYQQADAVLANDLACQRLQVLVVELTVQ